MFSTKTKNKLISTITSSSLISPFARKPRIRKWDDSWQYNSKIDWRKKEYLERFQDRHILCTRIETMLRKMSTSVIHSSLNESNSPQIHISEQDLRLLLTDSLTLNKICEVVAKSLDDLKIE